MNDRSVIDSCKELNGYRDGNSFSIKALSVMPFEKNFRGYDQKFYEKIFGYKKPCKFYKNGFCIKGILCPFSHGDNKNVEEETQDMDLSL